jgi:hypothetical protein
MRETFVERRKIIVRVELRDGRNGERKWQRERGFSSLFCTKKKVQPNKRKLSFFEDSQNVDGE